MPPVTYKPAPTCDRWRTYDLAMEMALHLYWKKWLRQDGRSSQPESIGHMRKEPIDESEDDLTCLNRSHQSLSARRGCNTCRLEFSCAERGYLASFSDRLPAGTSSKGLQIAGTHARWCSQNQARFNQTPSLPCSQLHRGFARLSARL